MTLRPPDYTRSVTLANTQTGHQRLWECPSDPHAKNGVRAWAVLQVRWSPELHQMVPTFSRLYTRNTGAIRERETLVASAPILALPAGGPTDAEARERVFEVTQAAIPAIVRDTTSTTPLALAVQRIFLAADVLDLEV